MINTSESTATGRRGSFGLKLGALVAACSLMLAGGVAVATSVYAAPNDNANGQGNKPDNPNKPDKPGNGGDNGGNPNPPKDPEAPPGSNNPGFEAGAKVWICHADANNGPGNTNLGNNEQGGENRNAFNIIDISKQAWLSIHDRLHENDKGPFATEAAALAACGGGSQTVTKQLCDLTANQLVLFTDPSTEYAAALADTARYATTCPTGEVVPATRTAAPSAPLCLVVADSYSGVTSVSSPVVSVTDATGNATNAQAAADEQAEDNVEQLLIANANGDNIIPPWTGAYRNFGGYNWTSETSARFAGGCSPNQRVLSAVSANAAASTPTKKPGAGKPAPGTVQVPAAGAPLPGSVPAGGGSSLPALPVGALALLAAGAIGAAASAVSLATSRKG